MFLVGGHLWFLRSGVGLLPSCCPVVLWGFKVPSIKLVGVHRGLWVGGFFHSDYVVSILQTIPPSKCRQTTKLFLACLVNSILLCPDFWHSPSSGGPFPSCSVVLEAFPTFHSHYKAADGPHWTEPGWVNYDTEVLTYFISNDQLFSFV